MAANRAGEIATTLSKPTSLGRFSSTIALSRETFWVLQGWGLLLLVTMSFFPRLFHVDEYLFFLLLASTIVVAYKTGTPIRTPTALDVPLLLFAAWVLLTVPFAIDPFYSFGEWRKLVVQIAVFYWALLVLEQNKGRRMRSRVMIVVVIATTIVSCYALQDFLSRGGTWENRSIRASAPSSDYNWLATYLVMAIPIIAVPLVVWKDRVNRVVLTCVGTVAFAAQAVAYTRAGWIGMIAEGVALGFFTARRQIIIWVLGAALFIGALLIALSHWGYQKDTIDPWTLADARLGVWKLQLQEVAHHPLLGIGYGSKTFMMRFSGYLETEKAEGSHSTFLMIAMGSGIPGVALLFCVMLRTVRVLVQRAKHVVDEERRIFMLAVAIMIVGFATRNIFDYMFAGSLAYLYWLLVASAVNSQLCTTNGTEKFESKPRYKDTLPA